MTAPEPTPTAEHIDAVAWVVARVDIEDMRRAETAREAVRVERLLREAKESARAVLTSTDPAVHAAMLDALVRAGVLTEERHRVVPSKGARPKRLVTPWEVAP